MRKGKWKVRRGLLDFSLMRSRHLKYIGRGGWLGGSRRAALVCRARPIVKTRAANNLRGR